MPIHQYGEWYYLIYLIPGAASLFILMASAFGGHHRFGGHGHAHGVGHGHLSTGHTGAGHHPAIAAHAGKGIASAGHNATGRGHSDHGQALTAHTASARTGHKEENTRTHDATVLNEQKSFAGSIGSFFGVGRVPITMVWGSVALGWGMFGVYGTTFWQDLLKLPFLFVPFGAVSGALGGILVGRFTAMFGSKLLPETQSFAVDSVGLFGCHGTVVYPVDRAHGRVHVYDTFGTLHDKEARSSSDIAIAKGRSIRVLDFDEETNRLMVEEAPDEGR